MSDPSIGSKRILFVVPSSRESYLKAKVKIAVPHMPSLAFAALAAPLISKGHEVEVVDLNMLENPKEKIEERLEKFRPDYVGITCTTPLFPAVVDISKSIKEFGDKIVVVGGGPHISVLPYESLRDSFLDVVVVGEGDFIMVDIVSKSLHSVEGIFYKKGKDIISNPRQSYIKNLDDLPYPAWKLFDIKKYRTPHLTCKKNPVGPIETSRGCTYGCVYCNKSIFGRNFRAKTPQRVVDEIEYMLKIGFGEIHVMDDGFTTDLKRAKEICDLIIERGLNFPWNLHNGIRVDRVDEEFLSRAYEAGCYRISYGIESGDQNVLNRIGKGITLDQARRAIKMTKDVGIETLAYFMIGLPGETEETIRKTIDFAKELDPDVAKVSITLPLPGTPLYLDLERNGLLKHGNWSVFDQHDPRYVYNHPTLGWDVIYKYYDLFYKEFYLRRNFTFKRLKRDLKLLLKLKLDLFYDLLSFLKTDW